ncbi:CAAX prenyl protease 1 homolog [Portunus trituberculatus]|uniref:CAAX prenyl protease 1 homolog n=1 Tax=Portunus trituberculatus TaxID=210409 RepID=UPI001E1D14D7|nr:CAAX prenyl protease 1 homolog [Portunus trituberculatus]
MISLAIPEFTTWEGKIFVGVLGFSWATYMWEEYLAYRQRRVYREKKEPPVELKDIMEKDSYDKARAYSIDKSNFGLISGAFDQVVGTGVMVFGGYSVLWAMSGKVVEWLGFPASGEIPQTVMFVGLRSVLSTIINLPWSVYFTFWVEQKHGFNKQTPGFFIKDNLKKFIVTQVISAPVVSSLVYIIKVGGDYFFIYLWGFTTAVMLFLMTIYPSCIAPLFDKYTPLPEGNLRTKIEALAKQIDFPLTKLYVVEGSKRSAHSNAYFYGFFKNKRIVLYDTLLEDYTPLNEDSVESEKEEVKEKKTGCSTEEVLAVLGHELGHWKLNHVLKGIIIFQVNLFLVFSVFGSLYKYSPLYRAFSFTQSQPAFIGLIIVMQYVFAPYNEILQFLLTMFSRHNEFQADKFARELGFSEKLKMALIKLNEDNLGFPVYDPLYSAWHHSHPPILERIRALEPKAKED